MVNNSSSNKSSNDLPGVFFNCDSKKWRVRGTSGAVLRLSFGEYDSKAEANEVGRKVIALRSRAEAFRLRDHLGIDGRGNVAKIQRKSLNQDRYRARQASIKKPNSITINLPKSKASKIPTY